MTNITRVQCADGEYIISHLLHYYNGESISLCMANKLMDVVGTLDYHYVFTYYNRLRVYIANLDVLPR